MTAGERLRRWLGSQARRHFYRLDSAPYVQAALRDSWNVMRYGRHAPRFAERLWIDPRAVRRFDRKGLMWRSGRVVVGAWPIGKEKPIEAEPILQASIARWVHGRSWEESGEVERMELAIRRRPGHADCFSRDDILRRCDRLDAIFAQIEREGRVRPVGEADPQAFREIEGIGMHIGVNGEPIRAQNGRHRFAIAWILGIPLIPVRVGLVHHSALPLLNELRQNRRPASGGARCVHAADVTAPLRAAS